MFADILLEEAEIISVIKRLSASLQCNSSLRSLTLKGNHLKKEHCELLAPFLSKNRHLEFLDVGCNSFGDKALGAITGALLRHPTLTTFKTSGMYILCPFFLLSSLSTEGLIS